MEKLIAVAAGGALGSLARYLAVNLVHSFVARGFPWGTLAVNVAGSLAIGALYVGLVERAAGGETMRLLLLVGVLGGFTTFSAFSIETLLLMTAGKYLPAAANIAASVALCIAAAAIGVWLARRFVALAA